MPETIEFDFDDLTLGDLEKLEDAAGRPAGQIIADYEESTEGMRAKDLTALIYVIKSRVDPEYTLDDARSIKIIEFMQEDDAVPPDDAAPGAATSAG